MGTCKRCGNPLILNGLGRCRFCGARAGIFRSLTGKTTYTKRGARRVYARVQEEALRDARFGADPSVDPAMSQTYLLHGMTWREAETLAWTWMRKHGYRDATLTASGPDGGVDVRSRKAVAQVKHHAKPVGLAEVQRLAGIASAERKKALLFAAAGMTKAALQWARTHGVECYRYPPVGRL